MFQHYRIILRELVINTLPSYTSIPAQLLVIQVTIKMFHTGFMQVLMEKAKIYNNQKNTSLKLLKTNAAIWFKKRCNNDYSMRTCIKPTWNILIVNCITDSFIWNTGLTWQGIDYKLSEDDTVVSKYVGVW